MTPVAALRTALGYACAALPVRNFVRRLGTDGSLQSLVYHNVAEHEDYFTSGLRVTIRPEDFERQLRFLAHEYDPISLQDALSRRLPKRPVLVTFDDAYRSVASAAFPIARNVGVPLAFFVNSDSVEGASLAFDNVIAWVANMHGVKKLQELVGTGVPCNSLRGFPGIIASLTWDARTTLRQRLCDIAAAAGIKPAHARALYISPEELASLAQQGVTIGNHTASHVHCRNLSQPQLLREIKGAGERLAEITGHPVRAFSVPYGSPVDAPPLVMKILKDSGYEAAFFVDGGGNRNPVDPWVIRRISPKGTSAHELFAEMEVIPRLVSSARAHAHAPLEKSPK